MQQKFIVEYSKNLIPMSIRWRKKMEMEKIEGLNIWLPEHELDELQGTIIKFDTEGTYGVSAIIKKKDGTTISTPSHKFLQNCLKRLNVGDDVKIVYEGEIEPSLKGQNPTKKYSVYRIKA